MVIGNPCNQISAVVTEKFSLEAVVIVMGIQNSSKISGVKKFFCKNYFQKVFDLWYLLVTQNSYVVYEKDHNKNDLCPRLSFSRKAKKILQCLLLLCDVRQLFLTKNIYHIMNYYKWHYRSRVCEYFHNSNRI